MGTWLVSEKIQKKTKRKQRLSLGLGATKPIDHTRARMVSRLAEIKAEVMCCMSTTADTLNHAQSPGSSLPGTRVAAHGKRAAPLLARFLLTAQGAGASGLFSQPRVRHGALGVQYKLFNHYKIHTHQLHNVYQHQRHKISSC